MKVLVVNAGSSSLKFTLFSMANQEVIASGLLERVGTDKPLLIYKPEGKAKVEVECTIKNHVEGLELVCEKLTDPEVGVIKCLTEVRAIGHRAVHGGEKVNQPVIVDENLKQIMRDCIPLAPLHNPANIDGFEACEKIFPSTPNVAVFDTAFHQTMPPEAYLYPLPYDLYKEHGVRRYGFHGTSHDFVAHAAAEFLDEKYENLNIITCHLGNGCSMAAIEGGKVVDTTMGMTPLEGLMMGTRCGDIDPAIVTWLAEQGKTTSEINTIMNKQSGILGVAGTGSSDMRDLLGAVEKGDEQATTAFKMFTRKIAQYIGAYAITLKRVDAIVFTGGVGEHARPVREEVVNSLAVLNTRIDAKGNEAAFGCPGVISSSDSAIKVVVIPTDEELKIAQSTMEVLNK